MKILITGADGLLGNNLIRLLLADKHEIVVLQHPSSNPKLLEGLPVKIFVGDILNQTEIRLAMTSCDAVVHAAALTDVRPSRSKKVCEVNIDGTANMVAVAKELDIKRFVYVGSASSYASPEFQSSEYRFPGEKYGLDYIDSKYEALQLVLKAAEEDNFPAISVLPTFMIGAHDAKPSSGKMILTLAQGKLKFYSSGGRNFVYVKDVAQAIMNALTIGKIGNVYVAGGENLTYKEFFTKVAQIVHQKAPSILTPNWLVKLIGSMGSFFGKLTGKAPMLSREMAIISCDKQFVSAQKAIDELKMPQTPIDTAIQDCYNWFQENKYV